MPRILITGGAGFIGSHLAEKLVAEGYDVFAIDQLNSGHKQIKQDRLKNLIDNKNFKIFENDLSDNKGLEKIFADHKFDLICHLAAKTNLEFDSELYNKMNILGTISIFELAKKFKVPKIVFASSSMVYGDATKLPFTETDNTDRPLSIYAATKKSDEVLAYTYHNLYKIKMVGLRFFTTYGPWGRPDMSIPKFTEQILKKEPIEVYNFGNIKRDYAYIGDIVNGITAALEKDFEYEIFNLGSGQSTELSKIISLIEKNLGVEAEKKYIPMKPGDLLETWANIDKAKRLLGYNPTMTIESGIEKYINWHRQYYSL